VLIAKDGTVFQSAPLTRGAWHVGRPGVVNGQRFESVNRATIGVELENAGPLVVRAGQYYAWPYFVDGARRHPDPRLRIAESRVDERRGLPFDGFPPAQIAAATELAGSLAAYFRWGATALSYAHADFAAPHKTDPGPLWMEELLPGVLGELGLAAGGAA
jgi:N-acetyl-anhydromuramyl-L-alanine amidase AmpD